MDLGLKLPVFIVLVAMGCGLEGPRNSVVDDPIAEAGYQAGHFDTGLPTHSQKGWGRPVAFFVSSKVPPAVRFAAEEAAKTWNKAVGMKILDFQGSYGVPRGEDLYSTLGDRATVIYYEQNWAKTTGKAPKTIATTIWENRVNDSRYIAKGDIILNAESYVFRDSHKPVLGRSQRLLVDAETVILHELGHLLGLAHSDVTSDPASIMLPNTKVGRGFSRREVSERDVIYLQKIYSMAP